MATRNIEATPRTRRLGRELRKLREAAGLTLADVVTEVGRSLSTLSRIEQGTIRPTARMVEDLLGVYGAPERGELVTLADQLKQVGWWQRLDTLPGPYQTFIAFEAEATVIRLFEPTLIPGLLQTPAYARTIITGAYDVDPSGVAQRVEARLTRQGILDRDPPSQLIAVVSEAVFRCPAGRASDWQAQLTHLATMAQRPSVTIRVLPFAQNRIVPARGNLAVLDFAEKGEPALGYVETFGGALFLESREEVDRLREIHDHLLGLSLDDEDSLDRIRGKS